MRTPGRPAKPMFPTETPLEAAFADLDEGALSYDGAAEFTSLSRTEIKRAVRAHEIETFKHKRRVLLVKRSVRMWLAKKLAEQRAERERLRFRGTAG
jgi:hypothetical protein